MTQREASPSSVREPESDGHVLLVDDDEELRGAVAGFLEEYGFRVRVAGAAKVPIIEKSDVQALLGAARQCCHATACPAQ